jgi:hypothetical protein
MVYAPVTLFQETIEETSVPRGGNDLEPRQVASGIDPEEKFRLFDLACTARHKPQESFKKSIRLIKIFYSN